ncbi:MAG: RNA degradosome polyphosphate kinase, partial [Bryobacteraceae bacterium]
MSPQTMAAQVALDLPSLTGTPPVVDLGDPRLYINREMSLLEFQRRVLGEARDSGNPLLERVKFLSIFMSNLDEFFMVRVAGLMQQVENKVQDLSADGQNVTQQLEAIGKEVRELVSEAYRLYREFLLPALAESGIHIVEYSTLAPEQRSQLESYFLKSVFPVLTPLAFDPGRPFPHISSLSLNLAIGVRDGGGVERFARVKVPGTLAQLVSVPAPGHDSTHDQTYIWLEQLITASLKYLFPEVEIFEAHPFHVTRDAEIAIQEIESDDLL